MPDFGPETYDRVAHFYDEFFGVAVGPPETVSLLAGLAGDGPTLELGIGTGRIAIPLAERGVRVCGIDASVKMVAQLHKKAPNLHIPVTICDLSEFDLPDRFGLIYVVGNTFFVLQSQEAQVRCFQRVAAHLRPGGKFVLACFVPDLRRLQSGQSTRVMAVTPDIVKIDATMLDPVSQTSTFQLMEVTEKGVRMFPGRLRWCWPSELDLMARIAGLSLENRWGDWHKSPFTATSANHVSVYVRGQ